MNDNMFLELNVNSNLAVRKPTWAYNYAYLHFLYTNSLSHVTICKDYNTWVLRVSKAFTQPTTQMLRWLQDLDTDF